MKLTAHIIKYGNQRNKFKKKKNITFFITFKNDSLISLILLVQISNFKFQVSRVSRVNKRKCISILHSNQF